MTFAEVQAFVSGPIHGISSCTDCHSSGGCYPQVFRNDDTLYDTLMTKTIEHCEGRVLVAPGKPEDSALYLVLLGDDVCGTIGQMPHGCYPSDDPTLNSCVDEADREALRLWILAGAPEN